MQYCCSQLRTKEMLDDDEDDLWWKPNFAQRYSASWNIVQVGGQTSPTLVSVGSATMLRDVASVWPGIKDTNGGSENKNCSVCTLETYNAELILWSIIFILKFFTWASQRSPSLKMPLGFFVVVFCLESQIAVWALIRMRASQIIIQVTDFLRKFQVLLGIQQPKNYRFDCEFVLKNYSNWPIPCILKSFCQMFEKHAPHTAINSLRNGIVVPSNRFRISRLAFRIIRVSFLGVNKDCSE